MARSVARPWLRQLSVLTSDDVIAASACANGVFDWIEAHSITETAVSVAVAMRIEDHPLIARAAGFSGSSDGYGNVNEYGDGNGYGDGDGSGYGYNDDDGYGYGHGYGYNDGDGYNDDDGYGHGAGNRYGHGYNNGDGHGAGHGAYG